MAIKKKHTLAMILSCGIMIWGGSLMLRASTGKIFINVYVPVFIFVLGFCLTMIFLTVLIRS